MRPRRRRRRPSSVTARLGLIQRAFRPRAWKHSPERRGSESERHNRAQKTYLVRWETCRDALEGSAEQVFRERKKTGVFFRSSRALHSSEVRNVFFFLERTRPSRLKHRFSLSLPFFLPNDAPPLGLVPRADTGGAPGLCVLCHGRARLLRAGRAGKSGEREMRRRFIGKQTNDGERKTLSLPRPLPLLSFSLVRSSPFTPWKCPCRRSLGEGGAAKIEPRKREQKIKKR